MANMIKAAAGSNALSKSPALQKELGRYILLTAQYGSLLDDICNQDAQSDVNMCGRAVAFLHDVDTGAWRDAALGGRLTHDQPQASYLEVTIGRATYKSVAVDLLDMALIGNIETWYRSKVVDSMWFNLGQYLTSYALAGILGATDPAHTGNTAGVGADIDLGSVTQPRQINRYNADDLFGDVDSLFWDTHLAPLQTAENITVVTSSRVNRLLNRSSGILNLLYKGGSSSDPTLTGRVRAEQRGYTLRTTPMMQSYGSTDTVLFIWKGAYMFYAQVALSRIIASSDVAADLYQMFVIYDGKMFYPQGAAIAIVEVDVSSDDAPRSLKTTAATALPAAPSFASTAKASAKSTATANSKES